MLWEKFSGNLLKQQAADETIPDFVPGFFMFIWMLRILILSKHDFVHQLDCILPTDIAIKNYSVHPDAPPGSIRSPDLRIPVHHKRSIQQQIIPTYFPYELDLDCMNQFGKILMEYSDFPLF